MNVSKSVFVVLLMSVVSMLMLSSVALASPPSVSVSTPTSTVIPGQSFSVTVSAFEVFGYVVQSVSLISSQGWAVSPTNTLPCNSQSCQQTFTVAVPSSAVSGSVATLLASAINTAGLQSPSQPVSVTVSGSGTNAVTFLNVPSSVLPGQAFTVTVSASAPAGMVSSITLSNNQGWIVSPSAFAPCSSQQPCVQTFTVTPTTALGTTALLTATANGNFGSPSQSASVTVSNVFSPGTGSGVVGVPGASISGVPASVLPGSSFTATVVATAASGRSVNSVTLVNTAGWAVSPSNTVTCSSGSQVCTADFRVTVPSSASLGSSVTFTATATTNAAGETLTDSRVTTVSAGPSTGSKVPVTVDAVEIDSFQLSASDTNVRDMERGEEFTLKVKLTASASAKDVEVRAFVTGFEFAKSEPISDETSPFDVEKGVSYVKTLKLTLPERVEEDTYRIRVIIGGRDNDEVTQNFRIKVTPTAHEVVVRDLSISPEDTVQAGRAILATVRVKNFGDKTERDVKVRVSIPELGVTATPDFIDELKSDESATSEEFFLRVDQCARPGTYDVKAEITFEQGDKVATARKQITVTKGPCEAPSGAASVSAKGVKIAYNAEPQNVEAGGAAVSYPVTIANDGAEARAYSLSVVGADWATVRLSPSNMVTVKPGDSQTVFAFVSAKRGTAAGSQVFSVRVKDQAGDVLKDISLSANVVGSAGVGTGSLVQLLQLGLIVLIVVLVVVGVVVAFRRMKGPGAGEEGTQTYY